MMKRRDLRSIFVEVWVVVNERVIKSDVVCMSRSTTMNEPANENVRSESEGKMMNERSAIVDTGTFIY